MTKTGLIELYKAAYKGRADESIRVPGNSDSKIASVAGITEQCDDAKNGDKIYMMLPDVGRGMFSYELIPFILTNDI